VYRWNPYLSHVRNLLHGRSFYEKLLLVVWRMLLLCWLCQLVHVGLAAHVRVLLEQADRQLTVTMMGSHRGYIDVDARQLELGLNPVTSNDHPNTPSTALIASSSSTYLQDAHDQQATVYPAVNTPLTDYTTNHTTNYTTNHLGASNYAAASVVNPSPRFETAFTLDWHLQAHAGYLYSETARLGRTLTLVSDSGMVRWRGQAYRGSLHLMATFDGILVINVLTLEDYLRGVVPEEMFANWPNEALKAQAIAARSYALSTLDAHAPFDICATFECQQYGGVDAEHPRSDAAIAATEGIVVTYDGTIARTYYHADSGGYTASSAEVWGDTATYLAGTPDAITSTPHRRWQHTVNAEQVAASLQRFGHDIGTLHALRVVATSASGRVSQLEVVASQSVPLAGPQLHSLLREWGFKSTKFTMTAALSAVGDGWGHGVGMSQYGAKALAENDYTYRQILAFYYPNTQLQTLPNVTSHSATAAAEARH